MADVGLLECAITRTEEGHVQVKLPQGVLTLARMAAIRFGIYIIAKAAPTDADLAMLISILEDEHAAAVANMLMTADETKRN